MVSEQIPSDINQKYLLKLLKSGVGHRESMIMDKLIENVEVKKSKAYFS